MQLHYQTQGQGQPLILVHGLFGSSNNWGTIAKHFSNNFRVISVDLRNHGKSPHNESQSFADMAEDLANLCHALNLDIVHLIGHSLGGKAAMQFAAQYPHRLNKLIIVDMALRAYADQHSHLIDAMMDVNLSTTQSRSEIDKALSNSINNTMVRQFLLMNLIKSDDGLQWRINLPALKVNYPKMQQALHDSILYDKPSLFIRGDRSDYVTDDDIEHIKTRFTNAQFASLPTDHWVHAEQPQAFIEVVERFLIN
jgi:pimeloyl-ACP methyl ester carboxylesterase